MSPDSVCTISVGPSGDETKCYCCMHVNTLRGMLTMSTSFVENQSVKKAEQLALRIAKVCTAKNNL